MPTSDHDAAQGVSRRHPVPSGEFTYEPSDRHVRATIAEVSIVDSYAPVLVWEPGKAVPGYAFPRKDVRTDLLRPAAFPPADDRHQQVARYYDLHLDGTVYPALAWVYDVNGLDELIAVDWFARESRGIEHWYEEDEEIFRHPRDPYKRVDAIQSSRHVTVSINGVQVAETRNPVLLFETRLPVRYYIPAEDVDFTRLTETELSTACPYKGDARYWSFTDGETVLENIVWSYPEPIPAVANIAGLVSFYNEVVDITVDGVPQSRPESEFTARLPEPRD